MITAFDAQAPQEIRSAVRSLRHLGEADPCLETRFGKHKQGGFGIAGREGIEIIQGPIEFVELRP